MNVIIYTRVSTDDQAETGFSLRHQEEVLRKYCEIKGYKVLNHFQDDYSAKTFNRPQWVKLFDYVKKNKKGIDMILFTKWDRFSRNSENALTVLRKFNELGILINSSEQPLDLTVPENKLVLAMYLAMPEVENDKNSARTKDCMRKAQKEGCFVNRAPYGYSGSRIDKKATLVFNNDTPIVKKAFEEVAKGIESVEAIRKRLKKDLGCKLEKQQFYNMLRNVVYKGCILIKEYKKEDEEIILGLHKPIVSDKLFDKVQDVLLGRKRNAKMPSVVNENFPLKKNLICPVCNKQITGSKSKGNGGFYYYYHCKSKCKVRYKKDEVDNSILEILGKISFSNDVKSLYKAILESSIGKRANNAKSRLNKLKDELNTIDEMIENAEDKLMKNEINSIQFDRITNRYYAKKNECENSLIEISANKDNSKKHIDKSLELLCNLQKVFNHLSGEAQASFLRVIYPENLIAEKGGFRTNSENKVIELLTRTCKAYESMEMKKATPKNGFSNYAPPLGLEPRTL